MNRSLTAAMDDRTSSSHARYENRRGEIETYFDRTAATQNATSPPHFGLAEFPK